MTRKGGLILICAMFISLLVFIFAAPKRKKFSLRILLCALILPIIGYYFPLNGSLNYNFYYGYFRQMVFLVICLLAALVCFKLSIKNIFMSSVQKYIYVKRCCIFIAANMLLLNRINWK